MELTQAQKDLLSGLKAFGCGKTQVLAMMFQLWHPEDTEKMIQYMMDNLSSSPAELYEMSSKISSARDRLMEAEEAENPEETEEAED